ncbi:MAG TPA: ABC transporter substrate-binding protein [Bacteroidales bacterium]|nr:MAG: Periplasmic binding protein [Bacteroidetes bacterium ADurb.Bin041]HNV49321.1 ABC transporter substrate-binding protein [Bacteroidales bacterium]HOG67373.1 ABC transporter substrate-binding protein [Bacteroidales bacterium]HPW42359.1 ABC transporter substrate-binding protein [Bacteroidales bacterium]
MKMHNQREAYLFFKREILKIPIYFFFLIIFASCHSPSAPIDNEEATPDELNPTFAKGFQILQGKGFKILNLYSSDGTTLIDHFILADRFDSQLVKGLVGKKIIQTPVESVVCLSATHIAFADALGVIDRVTGVASADYVVSDRFAELVNDGKIKEIGIGDHFKLEELISLNPNLILVSMQYGQNFETLRNAGLMILPIAEHLENDPLGRSEWIKLFGVLTGKSKMAMDMFDSIVHQYNELKELASDVNFRPTVLSGKQYGGFWNLPGGKSYLSQMISDAGATYMFNDNDESGSLVLDFETVYHIGVNADYWRILIFARDTYTFQDLLDEDMRYAGLAAFKNKKIFYCNTFLKPYFQKSPLEPHLLLADYISIFHPELLPDYTRSYYSILK